MRPGVIAYSKPELWKELSIEIREILEAQTDAKGPAFRDPHD